MREATPGPGRGNTPGGRQSGRGLVGFIVALVLVIYGGITLKAYYLVKSRHDKLDDFVYDTIRDADTRKMNEDQVRAEIYRMAKELEVPIADANVVDVKGTPAGWQAHVEWDDVFKIPGYSAIWHYSIDKEWKRF